MHFVRIFCKPYQDCKSLFSLYLDSPFIWSLTIPEIKKYEKIELAETHFQKKWNVAYQCSTISINISVGYFILHCHWWRVSQPVFCRWKKCPWSTAWSWINHTGGIPADNYKSGFPVPSRRCHGTARHTLHPVLFKFYGAEGGAAGSNKCSLISSLFQVRILVFAQRLLKRPTDTFESFGFPRSCFLPPSEQVILLSD